MTSYDPKRRKEDGRKWRIWGFFKRFFIVIGISTVVSLTLLSMTLSGLANYAPPPIPDNVVLRFDFQSNLAAEIKKPSFNQPLLRPSTTLHEVINALGRAQKDDRVKGFVATIEDIHYSMAQIQEIRHAIHEFRKTGRFAYVFADNLGGNMGAYYLASSFDEIWLQPIGMVSMAGLNSETPFLRNVLDLVGVTPEMHRRGRYKSTPQSLTQNKMDEYHHEMMSSIINDLGMQFVEDVAKDRGFTEVQMREFMNGSPYMDKEALEYKFIDKIDYADHLMIYATKKANVIAKMTAKKTEEGEEKEDFIEAEVFDLVGYNFWAKTEELDGGAVGFITNYFQNKDPASTLEGRKKIALIYASGAVASKSGKASTHFYASLGGEVMDASKISGYFDEAVEDETISVIVLRLDSPGGAPVASETIHRAITRAQEKGKKVVVSMGDLAASGGYWISAPADKIVAHPATLTGSIGVFAGKAVLADLWQKLGVKWETIKFGDNADMWSLHSKLSPSARIRFDNMLDYIYDSFVERVAEGRKMTKEQVEEIAQGRVWTGRQALEIGLVDELGGLDKAIEIAKLEAGLDKVKDVPVIRYPTQKSALQMMMKIAFEGASTNDYIDTSALSGNYQMQQVLKPFLSLALPAQMQIIRTPSIDVQ